MHIDGTHPARLLEDHDGAAVGAELGPHAPVIALHVAVHGVHQGSQLHTTFEVLGAQLGAVTGEGNERIALFGKHFIGDGHIREFGIIVGQSGRKGIGAAFAVGTGAPGNGQRKNKHQHDGIQTHGEPHCNGNRRIVSPTFMNKARSVKKILKKL